MDSLQGDETLCQLKYLLNDRKSKFIIRLLMMQLTKKVMLIQSSSIKSRPTLFPEVNYCTHSNRFSINKQEMFYVKQEIYKGNNSDIVCLNLPQKYSCFPC